eukprot:GILI01003646.1.p1 GENE.GILI01003646.1~~GILI01003646.1.p1  ORF type:complete len:152 (-),score=31.04 GILI01003646.1:499-906(-)
MNRALSLLASQRSVLSRPSTFNQVARRNFGAGHALPYHEPYGYLFGEKPLAAGESRHAEDWEVLTNLLFVLPLAIGTIGVLSNDGRAFDKFADVEAEKRRLTCMARKLYGENYPAVDTPVQRAAVARAAEAADEE